MNFLIVIIKVLSFVLFCITASYVFVTGKLRTGIKSSFVFCSAMLWAVMLCL